MKQLTLSLLFAILFVCVQGQSNLKFSQIKIDLTQTNLMELGQLGLAVDHGLHYPEKALINAYEARELQILDAAGVSYEVTIEDLNEFYRTHGTMDISELEINNRSGGCQENGGLVLYDYETPENYEYGTMGGYLPYFEALRNLDLMYEKFPNLITERTAISEVKTHQGRDVHYMVISNTPNQIDTTKPQILYTALHHAREPNSLSNLLFYMWFLLENYGIDEEVTYLVDNTSMFFVPIVNPDGYLYNSIIEPEGGGLWRKNRFPNAQGDTVGVDLNRNFGFRWFFDEQGSSSDETSQVYRGVGAFSEPESENLRRLCNENNFSIALNYHTHGNLLIHPWGFSDTNTDEDNLFKSIGRMMTIDNDFLMGTGTETVGYIVNGTSDDWMYGEEIEKSKIYAYTPEIGPSFWPGETRIDQLNKSAMRHNLNSAHSLGNFGWVKETFGVSFLTEEEGTLFFQFEKSGLVDGPISLNIVSETDALVFNGTTSWDLDLEIGETQDISIDYAVDKSILTDSEINFRIEMDNGSFVLPFQFDKNIRLDWDIDVTTTDNLDDMDGFDDPAQIWGLTDQDYFTAPYSITDSPNGNYDDLSTTELYVVEPFDTEDIRHALVKFMATYELEQDFDYVQFQVSQDGGEYLTLCGELTVNDLFTTELPSYTGIKSWSQETICIDDYLDAAELRFRFLFVSDFTVNDDGFYFDDFTLETVGGDSSTETVATSFLTISPNPTSDWIRVVMNPQDFIKEMTFDIFSSEGALITSGDIKYPSQMISIGGLPTGQYVFKVNKGQQTISNTKFIITK